MGLERLSYPDRARLVRLLALAIGVPTRELKDETVDLMVTVGQGAMWCAEYHEAAKDLAAEIAKELDAYASMNLRTE